MTRVRTSTHSTAARARQRGLSLIGLLLGGAVIVVVALLVMRIVPSALEYNAIRAAITKVSTAGGNSALEIQTAFDRQAIIDDIKSINGKDLLIERRSDGRLVISFEYEKRIPLFGPATLLIDYRGSSQ